MFKHLSLAPCSSLRELQLDLTKATWYEGMLRTVPAVLLRGLPFQYKAHGRTVTLVIRLHSKTIFSPKFFTAFDCATAALLGQGLEGVKMMKHSGSYDRAHIDVVRSMLPKLDEAGALRFS